MKSGFEVVLTNRAAISPPIAFSEVKEGTSVSLIFNA